MNIRGKRSEAALKFLEEMNGVLNFGGLLHAIRQGEGATQSEFSEQLGITTQYLCDLEKSRRFPSPKMAIQYARLLGYAEEQFLELCFQDMANKDGLNIDVHVTVSRQACKVRKRAS